MTSGAASLEGTGSFVRRRPPVAVRRKRLLIAIANHSLLIATALIFLLPFVFIVLTSLMTSHQALSPKLWPDPFAWHNYVDVFTKAPLWRYALNTLIYGGLATLGLLVSSIPVSYALARLRWRGSHVAFLITLVAMMLPPQVTIVPVYVLFAKLHLVGSLWPLILPNWFGDAFSIFLLRQFFLTIPKEYSDAARMDGASEWGILTRVIVPMARPGIAAAALFERLILVSSGLEQRRGDSKHYAGQNRGHQREDQDPAVQLDLICTRDNL